MATLQPGEKARMYALGGIMRGGASRGGYISSRVFISIDGVHVGFGGTPGAAHVGTLIGSLSIRDELDETPNTCTFRVNGMVPATGSEVIITLGSKNNTTRLFAGFALTVQQFYAADRPANVQADVTAVDYTWFFDFVKVTKPYRSMSASAIAADLVTSYAAVNGFTAAAVAPNLPVLDELTYTNEDLAAAFTRLARRIGGYWYVDYQKQVHLFLEETASPPEPLTPQHRSLADFQKAATRTQVLTRVYVEGRGTTVLGPVAVGETKIPLDAVDMFAVAPDVFAKISPQGSAGGAQHVTFTGVVPGGAGSLVGPGVGPPAAPTAAPIVGSGLSAGVYQYAYTDATPTGESLPSPVGVVTLPAGGGVPAPGPAPDVTLVQPTGQLGAGVYSWAYTFTTAGGGETTPSPARAIDTRQPYTPVGGVLMVEALSGGSLPWNTAYGYKATYLLDGGGETAAAPFVGNANTGNLGNNKLRVFVGAGYDTQTPPQMLPLPGSVIGVNIYRTRGNASGAWYFCGACPPALPIGTAQGWSFEDHVPDGNLGAPIPTTSTALAVWRFARVACAIGAPPVTGRQLYRTTVNGGQLRLVGPFDNTSAYAEDGATPDANLGVPPPATNTAGTEYRAVSLSGIAAGPSPTSSRYLYRSVVNGAQLKRLATLADNVTVTYTDTVPDASLGPNVPTSDTSGIPQPSGQVPAGSTTLVVAHVAVFLTAGGWAIIGNGEQVIRYSGIMGNALTGIPGSGNGAIVAGVSYNSTVTAAPMLTGVATLTNALIKGDELYLVVQRDDTTRQTALADMVNVGPGIREEWVQDRRLSITEARARGDATLALRPLEEVTITYRCRDLRTASGKTISVNLPAPTNVYGTFKIQAVTIDNFRPYPTQYPTYTVTASTTRFSFEDWLRRMQTQE